MEEAPTDTEGTVLVFNPHKRSRNTNNYNLVILVFLRLNLRKNRCMLKFCIHLYYVVLMNLWNIYIDSAFPKKSYWRSKLTEMCFPNISRPVVITRRIIVLYYCYSINNKLLMKNEKYFFDHTYIIEGRYLNHGRKMIHLPSSSTNILFAEWFWYKYCFNIWWWG